MATAIDTIKAAIATIITNGGNLITKTTHTSANNALVDNLYYQDWGIPKPWFGATAPTNHVLCKSGVTVTTTDCNQKFLDAMSAIGVNITGSTITIPVIPGGASLIQSGTAPDGTVYNTLGINGGYGGHEKHTLSESEMYAHSHNMFANTTRAITAGSGAETNPDKSVAVAASGDTTSGYHLQGGNDGTWLDPTIGITSTEGSGSEFSIMNPYFVVNYILRYA